MGNLKQFKDAHLRPVIKSKDDDGYVHIASYNTESLFNFGFVNPAGSVLTWGMCLRAVVMCGAATFVSQFRCKANETKWSFCFPVLANAEGLIFATLVSFVLGTFVTLTFSRWQSCREKIGTIMTSTQSLALMLKYIPREAGMEEEAKKLVRWLHLAHFLCYKQAQDDQHYQKLIDKGLMTPAEATRLHEHRHCDQPALVYSWCMHVFQFLTRKMLSKGAMVLAMTALNNCFTASQELITFIKTQLSYPYLHLITVLTKVHLVLVMIYGGGVVTEGITMHLWPRICLGYVIIIANNIIYEGLLQIYEKLHNPLGHDDADFPNHLYTKLVMDITNSFSEVPPPDEEVFYIKV